MPEQRSMYLPYSPRIDPESDTSYRMHLANYRVIRPTAHPHCARCEEVSITKHELPRARLGSTNAILIGMYPPDGPDIVGENVRAVTALAARAGRP